MGLANPRILLYGLLAGCLLSVMQAPLGLDWTQLPAVGATTAALFRAGALIAVALFLDPRRPAFRSPLVVGQLLFATAAGYALFGFVLSTHWQPEGRTGFAILLVGGTVLLRMAAGPAGDAEAARLSLVERLGLVVAAAGATIALENLAHHVRLLGLGLPEDDTVIGTVFLLILTVGAIAFGGLVARPTWERLVPAVGAAATAAATLAGLVFIRGLNQDAFFRYLGRFGVDLSRSGTWSATALLAAASLVVAGFVAGTTLSGARHAGRLASLLLGAAVGNLLVPAVVNAVSVPLVFPRQADSPWAWIVLLFGTTVATIGALVVVLGERGTRRWIGLALCMAAFATPWTRARLAVWSFSPWHVVPIEPELVVPTAEGLVTVEHARHGYRIVTLDRKRVSPTLEEEGVDARRMEFAWLLLDPDLRAARSVRVLFIGQLTPARARTLQRLGAIDLERTAPWFAALTALDQALFPLDEPAPGVLVSPAEARRRIRAGSYDLVLVMPVHGPVLAPKSAAVQPWGTVEEPVLGALDVPPGTIAVAWLDAASPLVRRGLGERVLVAMDRFQHLSVGIVRGELSPETTPETGRPTLLPAGRAGRRLPTWSLLDTLPRHRAFALNRSLAERLAQAAVGTDAEELARGLGLHFAAQRPSSPYETLAQQIEFDEDELRALFASAGSFEPDPFARDIWEGLAWLLTEKRRPDMVLVYLEPVADRYGPWPVLDRAVALAYRELLEPVEARRLYERVLAAEPGDVGAMIACAELSTELGEPGEAARHLRRALAEEPARYDLERALGIALFQAGDPEGRTMLVRLLEAHPGDEELLRHLAEGPRLPTGAGDGGDS